MIHGTGIDIVAIARIEQALKLASQVESRFAARVLAVDELREFKARLARASETGVGPRAAVAYVAKRFAAKEAFFKALGLPPSTANTWHQLSIASVEDGRPTCVFGPLLATLMRENGVGAAHVSLSDERDYAVASVTLERLERLERLGRPEPQ